MYKVYFRYNSLKISLEENHNTATGYKVILKLSKFKASVSIKMNVILITIIDKFVNILC